MNLNLNKYRHRKKIFFLQSLLVCVYFLSPFFHTHQLEFETHCETTHKFQQAHWHADFIKPADDHDDDCLECSVLTQFNYASLNAGMLLSLDTQILATSSLDQWQKIDQDSYVKARAPPIS
ncbi:MAG: hypothetical protein KC646_13160 [Candidatus Cloacimonetes bacterium]|nr:hypothetical protein [Candidatus Cloacimonadota bacterium]